MCVSNEWFDLGFNMFHLCADIVIDMGLGQYKPTICSTTACVCQQTGM